MPQARAREFMLLVSEASAVGSLTSSDALLKTRIVLLCVLCPPLRRYPRRPMRGSRPPLVARRELEDVISDARIGHHGNGEVALPVGWVAVPPARR